MSAQMIARLCVDVGASAGACAGTEITCVRITCVRRLRRPWALLPLEGDVQQHEKHRRTDAP